VSSPREVHIIASLGGPGNPPGQQADVSRSARSNRNNPLAPFESKLVFDVGAAETENSIRENGKNGA